MPEELVVYPAKAVKRTTAAQMLDCGVTTVRELCIEGKLKEVNVRSEKRVTVDSIDEYLANGGDSK